MYFLLFRIFTQLAFALKNRVALKIFSVFKYFLSFRIFGQLALALKTEFVLKIFKTGGAAAPPPRKPMTYAAGRHRQAVVTLKKYIGGLDRLCATTFLTLLHPSLGFYPYFGNHWAR